MDNPDAHKICFYFNPTQPIGQPRPDPSPLILKIIDIGQVCNFVHL